ncbi:cell adhesion molecule 1-like [Tachypleus tridentatus]|uniref:cell adhesion molecule 1-like n=1 Tax=Tachypleus tridentatus TaxID=6853 RepID=UPI003FD6728C
MYWVYLMVAGLILVTIDSSGIKLRTPVSFDESQEFPEFTTVVGGVADLPCNVSRPGPDDAVSLVLWYRADINPPIYSVDARNGDLMDAKHFSSDLLGSRAFFDLRTQPAIMKIKPVLEKDFGDYRCRVDYRWARTLNSAVTLTVKVPPKEIAIFNENNEMLKKIVGPLDEGSELKLTCQVKGVKPVDVRIKFFRRPLSAGKKVKIICQSSGSRPPAQVTWWKDNKPMSSILRMPPESQNVTVSELTFSPSREDNGKMLMCTSNNPKISGSTIEDKWNLTVFYKPEVIIKLGVNQVSWTVAEGRDIHLLCEVDAIPSITSSGWYFNDQAIQNDHLQRVAVNNLTLVIQRVQRHHSGYYRCFATNVEGRGESKNVLVKVECK